MEAIEVKHSNGAVHSVHFGMNALAEFCRIENLSLEALNSIGQNMKLDQAITLVFVGLKHGARKAKSKFELSREDIGDLMDEDKDFMNSVMAVMAESQPKQDLKKSPEAE